MALPFFRALNPASKHSGITYSLAKTQDMCQGNEMIDATVSKRIGEAFNKNLNYFSGLNAMYHIIVGNHYDLELTGRYDCNGGAKGVLDYLIFPLFARKLIADSFLNERKNSVFFNALAFTVAIPLEIVRFSAAIALTLLLAPIVALIHIIKACLPKNDSDKDVAFTVQPEFQVM